MAAISQTTISSAFLEWQSLIFNKISLKYIYLVDYMAALVQIMAWRPSGDKPLSEAMLVCGTDGTQWIKTVGYRYSKVNDENKLHTTRIFLNQIVNFTGADYISLGMK